MKVTSEFLKPGELVFIEKTPRQDEAVPVYPAAPRRNIPCAG